MNHGLRAQSCEHALGQHSSKSQHHLPRSETPLPPHRWPLCAHVSGTTREARGRSIRGVFAPNAPHVRLQDSLPSIPPPLSSSVVATPAWAHSPPDRESPETTPTIPRRQLPPDATPGPLVNTWPRWACLRAVHPPAAPEGPQPHACSDPCSVGRAAPESSQVFRRA